MICRMNSSFFFEQRRKINYKLLNVFVLPTRSRKRAETKFDVFYFS